MAWSSTAGFHQRSTWMTWSARVRLSPVPPALSESRKTGVSPRLEAGDHRLALAHRGAAVQELVRDPRARSRWRSSSRAMATYWVKTRTAPSSARTVPTSSSSRSSFSERPASRAVGLLEEVRRVVADLLEAGEQREHQAAAGLLVGASMRAIVSRTNAS